METGKRLDARPDAIEIFGDTYQSITNAVELTESVSKCFRRYREYSACHVWIIPDIRRTCAFMQEDVRIRDIMYLEYDWNVKGCVSAELRRFWQHVTHVWIIVKYSEMC